MGNLDHNEINISSCFEIHNKPCSDTEFDFYAEDSFYGFHGEADLVIKSPPSYLTDILAAPEKPILISHNVMFNSEGFFSVLFEQHFIRLISKALGEIYLFCLSHRIQGVLFLLAQDEVDSLTELQRHWLRDFGDLFSFMELSPKGTHQLYMPTTFKGFRHYCTLHALLEQSIASTQKGGNK